MKFYRFKLNGTMTTAFILVLIGSSFCIARGDDEHYDDLVHPCGPSIDLDCVRKYFKKNGRCHVVDNANKEPVLERNLPVFLSNINLTVIAKEMYLSNMDGDFEEFYLNKTSGNLVMSVKYTGLTSNSSHYFAIHQKGKEPKVLLEYVNATYPVVLTAIIPTHKGIVTKEAIAEALFSAYFWDTSAQLQVGPIISKSKDPVVSVVFEGYISKFATALQEIFETKATFYFVLYLQKYICNFGHHELIKKYKATTTVAAIHEIDVTDRTSFSEPCAQTDDVNGCVRNFFKEHGTCSVVYDTPKEPFFEKKIVDNISSQNISAVSNDVFLTGLDGKIREFYFNKETSNLVFAADFPNLSLFSTVTDIIFKQREKEPKILSDFVQCNYDVTFTAVIPMKKGISKKSMEKAIVTPYFSRADNSRCIAGPIFLASKDPEVQTVLANLLTEPLTVSREILVNGAYNNFMKYLQSYICDFGIPFKLSLY